MFLVEFGPLLLYLAQLRVHFCLKLIFRVRCIYREIRLLMQFYHFLVDNRCIKLLVSQSDTSYAHRRIKIIILYHGISRCPMWQLFVFKFWFLFWCGTPWIQWLHRCPKLQIGRSNFSLRERQMINDFWKALSFFYEWKFLIWVLDSGWCWVDSEVRLDIVVVSFELKFEWSDCVSEVRLPVDIYLLDRQLLAEVIDLLFKHIVFHI